MWRNILGQVLFQTAVILILLTIGGSVFDIEYANTDPFYPTAAQVAASPVTALWVAEKPTAKVQMYTVVF